MLLLNELINYDIVRTVDGTFSEPRMALQKSVEIATVWHYWPEANAHEDFSDGEFKKNPFSVYALN